ncbi:MAG TPA: enoyl-CoA hydratase [Acidimicrobiales bacterium]|nr:enoyl-CoA hydratase [Acidimicrobiales bacterium]
MSESLLVEHQAPITRITLNRPEKRNALSLGLMAELTETLESLRHDPETRIVVIAAAGPAFSAGHDLAEMAADRDAASYKRLFDGCTTLMTTIHTIPQPVIAQVHGVATAAGCQLVAACDLAVAEEGARFGTPGVKIGLFCSTPMVPISRAVGRKRALEMLLTGQLIDARTALDWGLVNRVVPVDTLREAVDDLATSIANASALTIAIGKQAFYAQIDVDERQAYDVTVPVMTMNAMTDDAAEGINAFLEKRAPVWRNS